MSSTLKEKLLSDKYLEEVKPHWYWDSWVLLALTATCCFMSGNLIISSLSHLGLESIFYFCGGATCLGVAYFYIQSKRKLKRRVLLFSEGILDRSLLMCYCGGAAFGAAIFFAISFTFKFCKRAGLNIGIAQTIWTLAPGLSSVMDYFIYGTQLKMYHIVGIICMLLAGSCISLSNLFEGSDDYADPVDPLPIYVPVLFSCLLPVIFSCFGMFTKYVFGVKKIAPDDFTFAYFLIFKGSVFVLSPIYFMNNDIDWSLYIMGFFGSMLDVSGCYFANAAVATGNPVGPIFALCDSQWLFVTILVAIVAGIIPHWMQLIGLCFGGVGALILSLTEHFQKDKVTQDV